MTSSTIQPGQPKKSLKTTLPLIFVSLSFAICLLELITHLMPELIPVDIQGVFQNVEGLTLQALDRDPDLGYKYVPNLTGFPVTFVDGGIPYTYTISTVSLGYDKIGFRDDGLDGTPFAVVIGDSYASCIGVNVDDCWVELLEDRLGKDFANLGVIGYGPQQEQRMLSRYGLPLNPRVVLWAFFGNDVNDAWRFDQFGAGGVQEGKFWQNPVRSWLGRHSWSYAIVSFFWYQRYLYYNLLTRNYEDKPQNDNLIWILTHSDLVVPEVAEGLALTEASLLRAYQETRAKSSDIQFVVVIMPLREQVYYSGPEQARLLGVAKHLTAFCRQQGIPVVDLTPILRDRAKTEPASIYFNQDIHLNRRGNQIVAELLSRELSKTYGSGREITDELSFSKAGQSGPVLANGKIGK